jgi:hypothetical protein
MYQTSTMGLETNTVSTARTNTNGTTAGNGELFTSEMYISFPLIANTITKIGKMELQTPLAFTETWNAVPNTFNGALLVNNSIENLTLVLAYLGQSNTTGTAITGEVSSAYFGGAYALVGHYKTDAFGANAYLYNVQNVGATVGNVQAVWIDANTKIGGLGIEGMVVNMDPQLAGTTSTSAYAGKVSTDISGIKVMAAYSTVKDNGTLAVGNTATGSKKSKLPTEGVYTDGKYVAQPGSDAWKVKGSTKFGGTGVALQYVSNSNSTTANTLLDDMTEIDLILTQKLGDVNLKAILMDRDGKVGAPSMGAADQHQQHVRLIASVNF